MSIERLKKLVLLGDSAFKNETLEAIQDHGFVHIIPLNEYKQEAQTNHYEELREALSYLKNSPHKRRLQTPSHEFHQKQLIERVLNNKRARASTIDEIELLRNRIKDLQPWGDFEYPDLAELSAYRLWFYLAPISKIAMLDSVKLPWKILKESNGFYFLLVIAKNEPNEDEVPFARVHVGSRSLSQLGDDLDAALVKLEDLNAERESLTRWIKPLTHSLDKTINLARMTRAAGLTLDDEDIFVLSGWVSESSVSKLEALRNSSNIAYTLTDPDEQDSPPTLLRNSDRFGGGETAVSFFQLPGYNSWDPSVIIFFSFALFFAVILSDAGYAAVLGVLLASFWKKLGRSQGSRRLRNLAGAIVAASAIYGVMIGSYFGIALDESGFLYKLKILDINNFAVMMQLSIGIGILHLVAANAIAGWQHRNTLKSLSNAGWAIAISSAYVLWLQYLKNGASISFYSPASLVFVTGLALVLLFSSDRKIHSLPDLALRFFDSILALYKLTKAFGDVLSYMRLFALGLSSASLAVTFNQLAVSASESVAAGGFILFTLIVLFGHVLNFVLAIMSGVIHGLRLNMLEFYNWGIEGEGYPFEAFKKNQ
ncbi:MAG: hypothetical protein EX270_11680 [Pseudomonadales bacterium]|nr:MAG: hypothetical protein EX270_11680 [Pseudomonadales bacterium]